GRGGDAGLGGGPRQDGRGLRLHGLRRAEEHVPRALPTPRRPRGRGRDRLRHRDVPSRAGCGGLGAAGRRRECEARRDADVSGLAAVYQINEWTDYPSAASRRRASSVYSINRSLTERLRRSASAASRSASSIGRTTVRRTQSSLSQTSSGVSDKLSPLGRNPPRRLLERDVAAQDTVAQEAQTAEIREARPLRQAREDRQMERRGQAGDRQVDVDALFKLGADCVLEPTP